MSARPKVLKYILLALLACSITGCSPPEMRENELRVAARWFEDDAIELFEKSSVLRPEVVFRWSFSAPEDLQNWTLGRTREISWAPEGWLEIRSAKGSAVLDRSVAIDANEIDAIEFDVHDYRHGTLQIWWAAAGESFSKERRRRLRVGQSVARSEAASGSTHTFHLSGEPGWQGAIAKIRLEPGAPRDRKIGLKEVRGVKFSTRPEALAAALDQGWKVDLGAELRAARLAPPGVPLEWPVELKRDSRLRFAYGLDSEIREPLRFSVSARRDGQRDEPLFDRTFQPRPGQPARWHRANVDLSALGPGDATLIFETETEDGSFDVTQGFPVWGGPELLVPAEEPGPINVILVSIDTLRADHLSLYGYERDTSPRLDAWAERSAVVFENAVAPAPWTLPSHVSMLTGHSPLAHGVNYAHQGVPRDLTLLAERLRGAGYSTLAVTGGGYLSPLFGFFQGFDAYRYWPDRATQNELKRGMTRAIAWLKQHRSSPFFLFLHTYEVHKPFTPRQPFLDAFGGLPEDATHYDFLTVSERPAHDGFRTTNRFMRQTKGGKTGPASPEDLENVKRLYDAGIAYADSQLNQLWQTLEETGLDRHTMVIVTSDHGEALGEKGLAGHLYPYDFNLWVPLIVALPENLHAGRRVEQQVSLVDIVPTVLEQVGLPIPEDLDGSSLLPLIAGEAPAGQRLAWSYAASSNHGVALRVSNRIKYIYNDSVYPPVAGREELYRLSIDPAEEHDLAPDAAELPSLRQRVRELLETEHQGLVLELENTGDAAFEGTLAGALMLETLRSPDLSCACLDWHDGTVQLKVPPGEAFHLFFQPSNPLPVRLTGAVGAGDELKATFEPATLAEPWQRFWDGSRWLPETPPGGTLRITARWQGTAGSPASALPEPDPALLEQLKALGYVD